MRRRKLSRPAAGTADARQRNELLFARIEALYQIILHVENVNSLLRIERDANGGLESAETSGVVDQRPDGAGHAGEQQRVAGEGELARESRAPIGAAAQQKMRCGLVHRSGGVGGGDGVARRIVVGEFAGIDWDVAAELLRLIVKPDQQLVVLNAENALEVENPAIDVGVINLSAERPAGAVIAAGERVEKTVERVLRGFLHGGKIGAGLHDQLHADSYFAVNRTDDVQLGGEKPVAVEPGANRLQRRVVRHRFWIFRIRNDDDRDHTGNLTGRKIRMIQRQRAGALDVGPGRLRREVFVIGRGHRAIFALQRQLRAALGVGDGFFVRSSGRGFVIDRALDAGKRRLNLRNRFGADVAVAVSAGAVPARDDV